MKTKTTVGKIQSWYLISINYNKMSKYNDTSYWMKNCFDRTRMYVHQRTNKKYTTHIIVKTIGPKLCKQIHIPCMYNVHWTYIHVYNTHTHTYVYIHIHTSVLYRSCMCTYLWTMCSLCKYSNADPNSHANSLIEFSLNLTSCPKWYLRSPPNNRSDTMNRSSSSEIRKPKA